MVVNIIICKSYTFRVLNFEIASIYFLTLCRVSLGRLNLEWESINIKESSKCQVGKQCSLQVVDIMVGRLACDSIVKRSVGEGVDWSNGPLKIKYSEHDIYYVNYCLSRDELLRSIAIHSYFFTNLFINSIIEDLFCAVLLDRVNYNVRCCIEKRFEKHLGD